MTGATVAVHFINHTIATAAQLKQMLHISNDNYFEWRFGNIYYTKRELVHRFFDSWHFTRSFRIWMEQNWRWTGNWPYSIYCWSVRMRTFRQIQHYLYKFCLCSDDQWFYQKIIGQKTDVITSGFSGSFVTMACHNEKELLTKSCWWILPAWLS